MKKKWVGLIDGKNKKDNGRQKIVVKRGHTY
mgnify:CR=1 FL=1